MKVIDRVAQKKPGALDQALGNLNLPFLQRSPKAQEIIINALRRVLDNKFFLLCNTTLEGLDVPIPLILIGPPGLWVIYPSDDRGVYRAKESAWEIMDNRTQEYKLSRPNLVTRTSLMAKAVTNYLTSKSAAVEPVEPVLFFANPGVHVDSERPAVRIVMADALERFGLSLAQADSTLNPQAIQHVVEALGGDEQPAAAADVVAETRDAFSFRDEPAKKTVRSPSLNLPYIGEPGFSKKIPFTRRQWLLLGAMLLLNIVILIAFVVIVLISA